MPRTTRRSLVRQSLLIAGVGAVALPARGPRPAGAASAAQATATPTGPAASVVASGLVNPRGFEVAPDGSILVALAGAGGETAGVAAVVDGCPAPIVAGIPSYRVVFAGPVGVADVARVGDDFYALVAGGNIDGGGMRNGLYRIDGGALELVADISAFIRDIPVAAVPRDYDTDGQPYALLPVEGGFWVTEGNSNQVLRVGFDGAVSRVADLSAGHPIPTGIAPAPAPAAGAADSAPGGETGGETGNAAGDGPDAAYVGFFTSIPYDDGAASVVRVSADGGVETVWTGLTLITALATGPDGALYALEMATGIDPADQASIRPGTGRVVRMTGPDSLAVVASGLDLPVAMRFGPDDALYVAGPAFGADDGQGTILRLDLAGATGPIDDAALDMTARGCPPPTP
jgi:hypothetical protein